MNKKLLVDIGNTRVKWMLVESDSVNGHNIFSWLPEKLETTLISQWRDLARPDAVYVSNVAGETIRNILTRCCEDYWQVTPFYAAVTDRCCGVTNCYSEPDRLGVDRWLAMIAGWNLCKNRVCIIDCGSAITLDVIDSDGLHQGGMIAPGLALSGRALTDHTHALTVAQEKYFSLLANNTEDAINSGCYHQFIGGIQHMIEEIQQQFGEDMEYIITGGDAELALAGLETKMRYVPDLILQGLILSSK